jgi:branched-chain amino acid transport system permease protein
MQRTRKVSVLLGVLAVLFSLFFSGASGANAADDSASTFTIEGTLTNLEQPVEGVKITATLDSFTGSAVSDADGRWLIEVPANGEYLVELDISTLPSGVSLSNPDWVTGIADLTMTNSAAVLFPLGSQEVEVVSMWDQLLNRIWAGLNFGLLLAIASVGISLIYGTTGLNNFAHGEMVTLGALLTYAFFTVGGWSIWLSAGVSIAILAGFGWLQDAAIWKPLRKRRLGINQMMIVSIGFGIVLRYTLLIIFGGESKTIGGEGDIIAWGPVKTTSTSIIGMVLSAAALAGVAYFLTKTRVGKATRAVSDNASLASATGIDVEKIIRIVWVFAAGLTGLAGILYGLQYQASWLTGNDILLLLFAAVTLGGLGTALGATVGALIIGMVVEVISLYIPSEMKYAAALVILILVLIVRPQGVLGKKQRIG